MATPPKNPKGARDRSPAAIVIRPRHELIGAKPGLPGYRRHCKCTVCMQANRDRMRKWRAGRKPAAPADDTVEIPGQGNAEPTLVLIDDLPPGAVTLALLEELPKIDGASLFQKTITAMMIKDARIVDNADKLERLDLLNSMQLRILNGIQLLERGSGGGVPADAAAALLAEFANDGQDA